MEPSLETCAIARRSCRRRPIASAVTNHVSAQYLGVMDVASEGVDLPSDNRLPLPIGAGGFLAAAFQSPWTLLLFLWRGVNVQRRSKRRLAAASGVTLALALLGYLAWWRRQRDAKRLTNVVGGEAGGFRGRGRGQAEHERAQGNWAKARDGIDAVQELRELGVSKGAFIALSKGRTHYILTGPPDGELIVLFHGECLGDGAKVLSRMRGGASGAAAARSWGPVSPGPAPSMRACPACVGVTHEQTAATGVATPPRPRSRRTAHWAVLQPMG